ncbi:peptidoglycan-recognition protein LC isoform X3 [Drosophila takahashii]|uniref:peptidoglycan-recognition protein LC isoform X3 n=1 Tax=Drosophila takahashii TaxID=29030 RepID=UPI001CF86E1B|nr:peptidoglycan-recognition protein LC isoform X2 [Drosophila takahashii]
MHFSNETEMIQCPNTKRRVIDPSAPKNCSTSSTDSGVILNDNAATFRPDKETKDRGTDEGQAQSKSEAKTEPKRISIEHTVNITKEKAGKTSSSPAVSIRSTTISIVSIDENAIDSSCIDSDSEGDAEDYTVQKLGHQVTYPPHSSHLRDLNQGLTVISRQVAPGGQAEVPPPNPLEAGVVAKQILNGNLALATPTSPAGGVATQGIGSIALTNSTDVTFGDKHFYEGPVTIQQFLIDNRDKWKAGEGPDGGQDNPAFNGGATANGNAPGSKLDDSPQTPPLCPFLPNTIGRKAVTITVLFVLLTLMLGVVLATTTNLFDKTLNQTDDVIDNSTLVILKVAEWGGRPAKNKLGVQKLPINRVVISHTAAEGCESREVCSARVNVVQSFHMDSWDWDHIGYNFLVGGDGRVYEGRGWDYVGAHTKGYNTGSVGISFIGTFTKRKPNERQLKACQLLLEEGVRLKKLTPNYRLYGHRQLSATESPGEELYKIIQTWPHWSHEI